MPKRLECEVLQKERYINTLTFTFTFRQRSCAVCLKTDYTNFDFRHCLHAYSAVEWRTHRTYLILEIKCITSETMQYRQAP